MFFGRGFPGAGADDDDDDDPRQNGGGGGGGKEKDDDPEHKKLYDALGVDKKATQAEIQKTFRKLAMTHHPDRGGDQEKFKSIQHAYEILSNEEKRASYDKYGEGGDPRGGRGGGMDDIFGMFGGGGRGGGGGRRRKGEDVVFPLKVELHELYKGASKKLKLTKNVICAACKGKGGKDGVAAAKCGTCRGQGVRLVVRQIGPGMIQQMQMPCNVCDGRGETMADKDKCGDCHGERTVKESKTLEVVISVGMSHGQRITFRQEADQAPDTEPGDVVVVLQQKEHPVFRREGMNLFMKHKLLLSEALAGFDFKVKHLDGKTLHVKSDDGMIVKPGDIKVIKEQGMPALKSILNFGNLYVEFDVAFPPSKSLDLKTRQQITALLGGSMPSNDAKAGAAGAKPAGAAANAQPKAPGGPAVADAAPKQNRKQRRAAQAAAATKAGGSDDDDDMPALEKQGEGAGAAAAAGGGAAAPAPGPEEDVTLEDVDMDQEKRHFAQQRAEANSHAREAHDDDDDDPRAHGHGPAGCRAQ